MTAGQPPVHGAAAATEHNRRAWDEIAQVRARWRRDQGLTPAFFAGGGLRLPAVARDALGEVAGRRVLHLQCATAEESLSLVNLGAEVTAVDLSAAQIEIARETARAAGLAIDLRVADVLALPADLQAGDLDVVYTATGVLPWIPDLAVWAGGVAAALRRGGRFVLFEEHPVAGCLWGDDDGLRVEDDYFARDRPTVTTGWAHFPGGEHASEEQQQFHWPLGDVVTAIARAGMFIERLIELPVDAGSGWRFGGALDAATSLPGSFVLSATRR